MWLCGSCNTSNNPYDDYCIECGCHKPKPQENHCSNPNCQAFNVILSNPEQKHCGKCGASTTYWKAIEDML